MEDRDTCRLVGELNVEKQNGSNGRLGDPYLDIGARVYCNVDTEFVTNRKD